MFTALAVHDVVIPTQVLGELFNVLTRKGGRTGSTAVREIAVWQAAAQIAADLHQVMSEALALAAVRGLQIWDSLILATAAADGCSVLFSEDMQDGFTWGGVTVVNPFAWPPGPLLSSIFGGP